MRTDPSLRRLAFLSLATVLFVAACSADGSASDGETETTGTEQTTQTTGSTDSTTPPPSDAVQPDGSTDPTGDVVDLTDQVLSSTDANCASHVGSYTSMITDIPTGRHFDGVLTISAPDATCRFTTNQIPNHNTGEGSAFRGELAVNDTLLEVTTGPELADSPTERGMNANVVMLNGVKWEAYPAACFGVGNEPLGQEAIGCGPDQLDNPWRYNIGSPLNDFGFDNYLAHLQPGGLYHYHSTPSVLYGIDCADDPPVIGFAADDLTVYGPCFDGDGTLRATEGDPTLLEGSRQVLADATTPYSGSNCEGSDPSPVVGFAADGFPVYGPCFEDTDGTPRAAQSGYVLRAGVRQDVAGYTTPFAVGNVVSDDYDGQFIGDYEYVEGAGDLDACNGMTVDGQYGYYVTGAYPYVLACYSGTPSNSFG